MKQLYVCQENQRLVINSAMVGIVENNAFRVVRYGRGELFSLPVKLGEILNIQDNGEFNPPTVTKVALPQKRGERIAYCLGFKEHQMVSTFDEFNEKLDLFNKEYPGRVLYISFRGRYGMAMLYNEEERASETLLAFIADDLNTEEVDFVIHGYTVFKQLPVPSTFLFLQ